MPIVAIIGAGFSGVATAVHLARLPWPRGVRIVIVERSPRFARGVAYSTDHPLHVLNVPAGRMGALADDEGHFLRWLRLTDPSVTGDAFVARKRYGDYLEWLLGEATANASANVAIERRIGDVVNVVTTDSGATLTFRDGAPIEADRVVLALGNLPPRDPRGTTRLHGDARYVPDPWAPDALKSLPKTTQPIVMIGSGLTMVDEVLAMRDHGHDTGFVAVSRHGLLPHSHRDWPAKPPVVDPPRELENWDGSAAALVRMVREAAKAAARAGLDWRDVVNGLRPITPQLWHRMSSSERERFLRHVRPYWDTHRHRMSTRVAESINQLIARRELSIVAGRVAEVTPAAKSITVGVVPRGGGAIEPFEAGALVNCTGPGAFGSSSDPLVNALCQSGSLDPDPFGLGFMSDHDGAVLSQRGRPSSVLFTLGSPRRLADWESTAVPELRAQADRLSRRLRDSLH